jgi:hypothetical protein
MIAPRPAHQTAGGYPASTFSHLARSVASLDFERFGRSTEQEAEYARFRDRLVREGWRSVSDYIRVCKLGFEQRRDGNGALVAGDAPVLRADEGGARTILIVNDFPYNFVPGIGHWVLWKIGAPLTSDDLEVAKEQLRVSENAVEVRV